MDKYIDSCKNLTDLYSIPWKSYLDNSKTLGRKRGKDVSVLIICNPCMGFGDIVFGMKFHDYLKDWYNCNVQIATTNPGGFKQLGMSDENLLLLKGKSSSVQCRKLRRLRFHDSLSKEIKVPKVDLIFIAPLTADFDVDYSDVRSIIPYSNRLNTFFLSEYNDSTRKRIDFHTGIGKGRLGLFLTNNTEQSDAEEQSDEKNSPILNPYSLIYIAETITRSTGCYSSFIEMVVKKYSKFVSRLEIVVPKWIANHMRKNKTLLKKISYSYSNISIITSETERDEVDFTLDNSLFIRGDIFPLPNKQMVTLIRDSVRDILLTGDQSITDVLSCCATTKNIFYQIAPWKENFGKNLSENLPNKFLKRKTTSCGTLKAIKYNSDYKDFNKQWDFRVLARPKMDAIFLAAISRKRKKRESNVYKFEKLLLSSRTLDSFLNKYYKF